MKNEMDRTSYHTSSQQWISVDTRFADVDLNLYEESGAVVYFPLLSFSVQWKECSLCVLVGALYVYLLHLSPIFVKDFLAHLEYLIHFFPRFLLIKLLEASVVVCKWWLSSGLCPVSWLSSHLFWSLFLKL